MYRILAINLTLKFNKMAKYIFTTNFDGISPAPDCAKGNPPCPYMPFRQSFKKGDVVEGTLTANNVSSEPPNFVVVNGGIQVPFGGRGSQIIQQYSTSGNAIPIGQDNANKKNSVTESATFFTPKNVVIGVLIIGSVFGGLKFLKVI